MKNQLPVRVVIPSKAERNLIQTLQSLADTAKYGANYQLSVIVVINDAENSSREEIEINEATYKEILNLKNEHLTVEPIYLRCVSQKRAGVGWARKTGMDKAAQQLINSKHPEGIILCLDADTLVAPNYLTAVIEAFYKEEKAQAASIHFEHPLSGKQYERDTYQAAMQYELHLRYYIAAQRYCGFPFAFQTVGSAMAVRAVAYLQQGGMNKRKAGEDFYFLHKYISIGKIIEINDTTVYPSPRASDRVPFGTGRAVSKMLEGEQATTYALDTFIDLYVFFKAVPDLYEYTLSAELAPWLQAYLESQVFFEEKLPELRKHTASQTAFVRRFFQWFDAFRLMKAVHFARDHAYVDQPTATQARRLAKILNLPAMENSEKLLQAFRSWEQQKKWLPDTLAGQHWLSYIKTY